MMVTLAVSAGFQRQSAPSGRRDASAHRGGNRQSGWIHSSC